MNISSETKITICSQGLTPFHRCVPICFQSVCGYILSAGTVFTMHVFVNFLLLSLYYHNICIKAFSPDANPITLGYKVSHPQTTLTSGGQTVVLFVKINVFKPFVQSVFGQWKNDILYVISYCLHCPYRESKHFMYHDIYLELWAVKKWYIICNIILFALPISWIETLHVSRYLFGTLWITVPETFSLHRNGTIVVHAYLWYQFHFKKCGFVGHALDPQDLSICFRVPWAYWFFISTDVRNMFSLSVKSNRLQIY